MEIDIFCCVPDEALFSHVRENSASCRTWAKSIDAHDGAAVIVGGGPSLRNKLSSIKKRKAIGQKIFALNGAAKFLNENGIRPDYQVLLDPQQFLPEYIAPAYEHLVASQCHPAVFGWLPRAILWHCAVDGVEAHIPEHHADYCLVGGGVTVGLCAICLVYAMGYRKLHLYGYDSSVTADGDHAYRNPRKGLEHVVFDAEPVVTATLAGRKFRTTFSLARQAQLFPDLCNNLTDMGCLITVEADGLIMAVVDEMRRASLAEAA